jgi:hypothetical protein
MFWIVKGYDVNKYMEKSQELFLVILLYQKKILGLSFPNKQKNKNFIRT